jgi:hypothetical protein
MSSDDTPGPPLTVLWNPAEDTENTEEVGHGTWALGVGDNVTVTRTEYIEADETPGDAPPVDWARLFVWAFFAGSFVLTTVVCVLIWHYLHAIRSSDVSFNVGQIIGYALIIYIAARFIMWLVAPFRR